METTKIGLDRMVTRKVQYSQYITYTTTISPINLSSVRHRNRFSFAMLNPLELSGSEFKRVAAEIEVGRTRANRDTLLEYKK